MSDDALKISKTTAVGSLTVSAQERPAVALETLHWQHYCERIEEIDMPSLDEANFFTGSAGVAVSMVVALVGVIVGTTKPSPYLIAVLVALLFASLLGTAYFGLMYRNARARLAKSGARISKEMRAIAAAQTGEAGAG